MVMHHPIDQVANDAADQQTQRQSSSGCPSVEMAPGGVEDGERGQGNQCQEAVVVTKEAPRRAGITPVHKFEKTVDDDSFLRVAEKFQYQEFRKLIQGDHRQSGCSHAFTGGPSHEFCGRVISSVRTYLHHHNGRVCALVRWCKVRRTKRQTIYCAQGLPNSRKRKTCLPPARRYVGPKAVSVHRG